MTKPQSFFDSSFLVALVDEADFHHEKAVQILDKIEEEEGEIFLSDLALNETLSVLAKRCEARKKQTEFSALAESIKEIMHQYPILSLYELVPQNYGQLVTMMIRHEGELNFHDCLIVLFLEQLPEVALVTFDNDFKSQKSVKLFS